MEDLDFVPLIKRRKMLYSKRSSSSCPSLVRRPAVKRVSPGPGALQVWPGLPRGVKFDPSDGDLLWHLLAKVGKGEAEPHPFISDFIISLEEGAEFGYCHPCKLPGVKQDGGVSYFFHRAFKSYGNRNRKPSKMHNCDFGIVRWHKIGKTKRVYMDGIHQGCKRIMVLYMSRAEGEKPQKTNWVMHQYHIGTNDDEEGEFVVSKIFYQLRSEQGDKNAQPLDTLEDVGTDVKSEAALKLMGPGPHAGNPHSCLIHMELSTQAAYNDTRAEENIALAGCCKLDNYDHLSTSHQGISEPRVLLDSQHNSILTSGSLLQKQFSFGTEAEISRSCISDSASIDVNRMKKDLEECGMDILMGNHDLLEHTSQLYLSTEMKVDHSDYRQKSPYLKGLDNISYADVGGSLLIESETDELDHISLQERQRMLLSVLPYGFANFGDSRRCQDHRLRAIETGSHSSKYDKGSRVITKRKRSETLLSNLGTICRRNLSELQELSSADAVNLRDNLNECIIERVNDEIHFANADLGDSKSWGDPLFETLDSVQAGSPVRINQSSPSLLNCSNDVSLESSHSQESEERDNMLANEKSVPEYKLSAEGGHAHMHTNSQPHSSSFSTSLVQLKSEPVEENHANNIFEGNVALLNSIDRLGFPNEGTAACSSATTPCLPEARYFSDNPSLTSCNSLQNERSNFKCSNEEYTSEHRLSCLRQLAQTDDNLPPLREDVHYNSCATEILSTTRSSSLDNVISNRSCMLDQCSSKDANFQYNILPSSGNLEEPENIGYDEASKVEFDAKNKLSNPISSTDIVQLKLEILETGLLDPSQNASSSLPKHNILRTKVKSESFDELSTEVLDQIPPGERIEMPVSGSPTNHHWGNNMECSQQIALPSGPVNSLSANESRFSLRRRKRKKTATDSVETALEEDAPGLLKVLLDKGVTIEEIKLFGEMDDDETLEVPSTEESFEELETVIAKLFSEGPSLFKFPSVKIKGSKAAYCLSCLISLIEQARYLHFRQSPVEWGWCRDLQSFIFIFERHNRIVLERPEYGYATYFFELVESLPIDWQIKRLVTAMKLPTCSRTTLLENRSLLVGRDLTEGEARVLEEYGWTSNSGLGTMLNYRDRVVHDKKNERYSSEWRAKIGKMLMSGHDGGRTILSRLPKNVLQYMGSQNPEIKLEI